MFMDRLMDKQNVVRPPTGLLFNLKKEWNSETSTTWVNLEDIILTEFQIQKNKYVWFHFHEVPKVIQPIETESGMVVARDWGRGNGELLFNGTEFQFEKIKILKMMVMVLVQHENVLNATKLYT